MELVQLVKDVPQCPYEGVICPQGMLVFQIVRSDLEKKKALSEKNLASSRLGGSPFFLLHFRCGLAVYPVQSRRAI